MKKTASVLMVILLTLTLASCGIGKTLKEKIESQEEKTESQEEKGTAVSKTEKIFENITKETGMHMKCSLETGGIAIEEDMYKKDDSLYADILVQGQHVIMIVKGDSMYILDDASKTAVKADLEGEQKTQIDEALSSMDSVFEAGTDYDDFKSGTVKIDGMNYDTEEYSSDGKVAKFVYNDDGDLVYVIVPASDSQELRIKIDALDGEVKDEQFDIPADYNIVDTNGNPVSGGADAGSLQTVTSEVGGFSFKTGKDYIINISGSYVDVYLQTQSSVPSFRLYPFVQVSGQTPGGFIDQTIEQVKKNQQNKLAGEPEKTTITVNGREIEGFRYAYSTDDGKGLVISENYVDLIHGTLYSWGSFYMEDDKETPAALRTAMESFELK